MNEAIEQMLSRYQAKSEEDYVNALKEIIQEIILLGLDRNSFFEKAAFYGGTALRHPDSNFKLDKFFSGLEKELSAFNFQFQLERVNKSFERTTESAFLKASPQLLFLNIIGGKRFSHEIQKNQKIKIKFEVDVSPVTSFKTEIKTLLLPTPFTVKVLTPPSLFAGKMHAVLLRNWKERIKGRDFYDLQWYIARNIPILKIYLEEKMQESMALTGRLTKESLIEIFNKRIVNIDWEQAKQDVLPFLKDKNQVKLWSNDFFTNLINQIILE